MKAELTRKVIEEHVPKTLFKGKCENYKLLHVNRELDELERLAEIGKATERAFEHSHIPFYSVKDLLYWYKREMEAEDNAKAKACAKPRAKAH